ncbi:MAG TPA: MraY family glycosyltransferase [Tepidisphaeraceae bacterium]|nr:MraY family glycosyltransferase [Tepidisphaeraceae bacterium]
MLEAMLGRSIAQLDPQVLSADQVLAPYIYVFYVAFIVTFVFTPLMRLVATQYGVIDEPDLNRKVHKAPVAYLGGVAMFLGWICGLAISQYLTLHRIQPGWPTSQPVVKFSIVVGGIVIVVLGLWDDVRRVSPRVKIAGQILASLFLLWDGVGVDVTRPLLSPMGAKLAPLAQALGVTTLFPEWLIYGSSAVVVVAIVVGCCNASNLMDGLDGLCGGVTAIIALGFLFVAVHLAAVGGGVRTNSDALRVILALALLGAVLGFTPYNFNPASIFMGDTGSMLLGFSSAVMIIMMGEERTKWLLAATVMFALPILDTGLAFARRWVNRRPIFSADKQHFHHQLMARGFTVKQTVMISYGLAVLFGLLGVGMVLIRTRYAIAAYLVIFGSIIVAAYKMGMVHERPSGGEPAGLDDPGSATTTATIEPGTVFEIKDRHEVEPPPQPVSREGDRAA